MLEQKYLRKHNFFEVKKTVSPSTAWKGILDIRELLKGIRWIVGDGKSINFGTFNWLLPFPLYHLVPDDQKNSIDWNLTVNNFIDQ